MKEDIFVPHVENIGVAVTLDKNELGGEEWNVYIINYKGQTINNVLVSSKGYGIKEGKNIKTSTLTHFFEEIAPHEFKLIEPITEEIFGITNEYFITFYIDGIIHDKKFIFLPEAIQKNNLIDINILEKKGVLIK